MLMMYQYNFDIFLKAVFIFLIIFLFSLETIVKKMRSLVKLEKSVYLNRNYVSNFSISQTKIYL